MGVEAVGRGWARLGGVTNRDWDGLDGQELAGALRAMFPYLPADDTAVSPLRGGRAAAVALLEKIDPVTYERSRNFLDGDVTRLSAYLRHGVLTLAEVRDKALEKARDARQAGKLVNEFAWRGLLAAALFSDWRRSLGRSRGL